MLHYVSGDYLRVFENNPSISRGAVESIQALVLNCIPQKTVPLRIKASISPEEIDIMASVVTSLNPNLMAYLVPLSQRVYKEHVRRGYQERLYFICPSCTAVDFPIEGGSKRKPVNFAIDGLRDYIRVCPVCDVDFGVPIVRFNLAGRLLILEGRPIILCTRCALICDASIGRFDDDMFFVCGTCSL